MRAGYYHAGMGKGERAEVQERFMADRLDVIVATAAFGMGVDKPDVRFVYHYEVPGSLDAYWQEVGRPGRDGEPARGLLFYRPADVGVRRAMASRGRLREEELAGVAEALLEQDAEVAPAELADEAEQPSKVARVLNELEQEGRVEHRPDGTVAPSE